MTSNTVAAGPLYRIQKRALADEAAAQECADRYAHSVEPSYQPYGRRFLARLAFWYLVGLRGQPVKPSLSYSNFERPLLRAWRAGAELRKELLA